MKLNPVKLHSTSSLKSCFCRHRLSLVLVAVVMWVASLVHSGANTITWIGGVGDFSNAANWDGGNVPMTSDSILIQNGGTVQSSYFVDVEDVTIGDSSTYAVLAGLGSQFTPDSIFLGTGGTGTLTIGSEALVAAASNLYLGYDAGSTGVVSMTGAYLSPFTTYVGYAGPGNMTLESGSTLQSTTGYVGYQAGSTGLVQLTNSTWKAEDQGLPVDITVGADGQGEVQATSSLIDANNLTLGNGVGGSGEVSFNGGTLTLAENITVGNAGNGTLSLSNSATATNAAAVIGALADSTGSVTLTNSTWTVDGDLDVGLAGEGTLNATGSQLEAQELFVARSAGSTGTATISGGTTTVHKEIHVGAFGSGEFTLEGNGILNSDKGNAGFDAAANGTINIADSLWTVTQAVFVGVNGEGTVNISSEGGISSESGYIGQNASGQGTVNITTEGSWSTTNTLAVGVFGTGNLTASGGGEANSVWGQIGLQTGSSGTVNLNGGMWTSQNTLTIGVSGNGQLTATNGSTVSAQQIELAASGGTTGTLSATDSLIETEVITPGSGTASLSLSGARINLLGGSSVVDTLLISGFATDAAVIGSGGLIVDTQGGNAQITTILSGAGSLTKEGTGRLRLTAANTFSGGSVIDEGVLEVANDLALGDGSITLRSGELRASTDTTLSGNLSSGIQIITVKADQTGTFSAVNGQTLTLATMDFLLEAGSTMQVGSAGNAGTVIFAPTGAVALPADAQISVDYGTLQAGNDELLFMADIADSVTVTAGATLDFNDQVTGGAVGNLLGGGTVQIGSSASSVLAIDSGTFSGEILGSGSLAKQSAGTLILSGQNTISGGTTVSGGLLQVDGFLGNGLVEIQSGGTLGGSGEVVEVSLNGGTLAPGSSAGTLTLGNLFWYDGTMLFELGPSSDHLSVGGLQGFGGPYLFTFADLGWTEGTTYDLITFGVTPINFDLADIGYTNSGGFSGSFAFDNDVLQFTLHTIPEPSTSFLLLLAVLLAFHFRRQAKVPGVRARAQ